MGARAGGIIMTVLFSWLGFFVWMICTTIPRRVAREEADLRRQVALIQALKN
jgi:nitrate/nitrite transporter NarK